MRRLLRLRARSAILLQDLGLSGGNKLILLLGLGLLDNLADAGVRVENRLVLHLSAMFH